MAVVLDVYGRHVLEGTIAVLKTIGSVLMKCLNCGSNIPASAKFCGVCGVAIAASKTSEPAKTVALDTSANPEIQAATAALEAAEIAAVKAANAGGEPAAESESKPESVVVEAVADSDADVPRTVESESVEIGSSQPAAAVQQSSAAPTTESTDGGSSKKGKFRETIWFMQADDPEMMSAIENEKLEDRKATYQDPGGSLDERSREKFSLNISESTMMKAMEREAMETSETPENSKSWFYASVVIGAIVLTAGIYFMFFAGTGTTP